MEYFKALEYEELTRETKYQGQRLGVEEVTYQTPKGVIKREHVIGKDAVIILPITEDDKVIMVQEPRTALNEIILELPAGLMEEGEDPKEAALRELEEETGYKAKTIDYLLEFYPAMGFSNEKLYVYVAYDFEKTKQHLDPEEDINVHLVPMKEVEEMVRHNEFKTPSINIAMMYYLLYKGKKN